MLQKLRKLWKNAGTYYREGHKKLTDGWQKRVTDKWKKWIPEGWQTYGGYRWHFILAVSLLVLVSAILYAQSYNVATGAKPIVVTIKPGMSSDDISQLLVRKGIIGNEYYFRFLVRMKGLGNSLRAGEYDFTPGLTTGQVLDTLASGENVRTEITIPEGYTIDQIAKLLDKTHVLSGKKFKELAKNYAPYDYMKSDRKDIIYRAEGFAFPDTYEIDGGMTEAQLLKNMVQQFNKEFTPAMRARAASMGLSIRDTIILASLVEKEAKLSKDRPVIAGVFLNRLKIGMPLQSCATIQYILGYPKPELSDKDTQIPSPYNTYLHNGLPPGPIANPGLASIKAVLNPAHTDYLYFVADKYGAHHFSKTYAEHLKMVAEVMK
jgi:UPF0755 protein